MFRTLTLNLHLQNSSQTDAAEEADFECDIRSDVFEQKSSKHVSEGQQYIRQPRNAGVRPRCRLRSQHVFKHSLFGPFRKVRVHSTTVGRLWKTLTASVAGRPRRALEAHVALHRLGRGAFYQVGHTRG